MLHQGYPEKFYLSGVLLEELRNRPRLGWTDMSQDQIATEYQQRQISQLVLPVSTPGEQFQEIMNILKTAGAAFSYNEHLNYSLVTQIGSLNQICSVFTLSSFKLHGRNKRNVLLAQVEKLSYHCLKNHCNLLNLYCKAIIQRVDIIYKIFGNTIFASK
mgnify:CR=1 FL=1